MPYEERSYPLKRGGSIEAVDDALTTLTPLHAAEPLVLGAGVYQPRIFDLCGGRLTA